jgi:hypothetical protein
MSSSMERSGVYPMVRQAVLGIDYVCDIMDSIFLFYFNMLVLLRLTVGTDLLVKSIKTFSIQPLDRSS